MASKKKVIREPKPTPAKFLVTMEELIIRLRRANGGFRSIAVRLPHELNSAKWVKENFPVSKGIQDKVIFPKSGNVSTAIREAATDTRTANQRTAPFLKYNRFVYIASLNRELAHETIIPFYENNVLFWFYTDESNENNHSSYLSRFNNHMYYNSEFNALVIDRWDSIPNYQDSYILLKQG